MADSFQAYTGGNTPYSFTKPFLRSTDIKVEVDGSAYGGTATVTPGSAYPYTGAAVALSPDAGGSTKVKIYRDTAVPAAIMYKDFTDSSVLKAVDLDDIQRYLVYLTQEKAESTKDYDGALPLGHVKQIVAGAADVGGEMTANTTTTFKRSSHRITATPKAYSSTWIILGSIDVLVVSEASSATKSGFIVRLIKDDSASVGNASSGGTALGAPTDFRVRELHSQENVNSYYNLSVFAKFTTSNRTQFTVDPFVKLFDSDSGTSVLAAGALAKTQLYAIEIG